MAATEVWERRGERVETRSGQLAARVVPEEAADSQGRTVKAVVLVLTAAKVPETIRIKGLKVHRDRCAVQ